MPTLGSLFAELRNTCAEHWKNQCFEQNMEITYNMLF